MCREERCKKHGPVIRFPFRIKGKQPDHCGYPGFDLSCTDRKETLLELPTSVKLYVKKIDYAAEVITANDPENCLPRQLLNFNLSTSPFKFATWLQLDLDFFNCTSGQRYSYNSLMSCLGVPGYDIYFFPSGSVATYFDLTSCTKMYSLPSVPDELNGRDNILHLNWSRPACGLCGAQGKLCRLKNNTDRIETECYDKPKSNEGIIKKIVAAVTTVGSAILLLIVFAFYRRLQILYMKCSEDYRQDATIGSKYSKEISLAKNGKIPH
ncbi:RING/U-BOX SUPERFAMILY PROTEIN [Salix koriyanagi]|uniref:RING-type E3 ubiquitin transferase n=1 Tax=Salix koriyanagi TaxID=2511006 RepID=A0A9Q0PFY0_9ROSI|nr:RING/U-BOX SUPERFAMILY PROTEIN [Salix koriyanagi]